VTRFRNSTTAAGKPVSGSTVAATPASGARADASAATMLAPRVVALSKITMGAAMAYMLIGMF
jgi:hypothetical protein